MSLVPPKRRSAADIAPNGKPIAIKFDGNRFAGGLDSNRLMKDVSVYHMVQSKLNLNEVLFFGDSIGSLVIKLLYIRHFFHINLLYECLRKVFIGVLADPSNIDFEPILLCLDADDFQSWMVSDEEPDGFSWSRCNWQDFFKQAGHADTADQVSLFVDQADFGKGIEKFLVYASSLDDDGKDKLFRIFYPDGIF